MPVPLDPDIQSSLASLGLHLATRVSNVIEYQELLKETHSERAAIREYLGGMSRREAELYALTDTAEILGIKTKEPR